MSSYTILPGSGKLDQRRHHAEEGDAKHTNGLNFRSIRSSQSPHRPSSLTTFQCPKISQSPRDHERAQEPPTIRMPPYLAPASSPCANSTLQTTTNLPVPPQRSLFVFILLSIAGTFNRAASSPFQSTPLFPFQRHHLLALLPSYGLFFPPPLDVTGRCQRACISLHPTLGPPFLLHSLGSSIFAWLLHLFLQPRPLLCVPNTATYLTFPLG